VSGREAEYQLPLFSAMRGHITPHERIPPSRTDTFTMYGQIIPTPTYVGEKSKKNLNDDKQSSVWEVLYYSKLVRQIEMFRC
jgi:hypothetical protein